MRNKLISRMVFLITPMGQSAFAEKKGMNLGTRLGKALARKLGYDLALHVPAVMLIENPCYSYVMAAFGEFMGYMEWRAPKYLQVRPQFGVTRKMIVEAFDERAAGLLEEPETRSKNFSDVFVAIHPQDFLKIFKTLCRFYRIPPFEIEVDTSKTKVWSCVFDLKAKTAEIVMPARTATRYK